MQMETRNIVRIVTLVSVVFVWAFLLTAAQAGITVTEDQVNTAWPADVDFNTCGGTPNLASAGYAPTGTTVVSQTITAPSSGDLVLDKISIGYNGATLGTYQVMIQTVSDPNANYTAGTNLLTGNATFTTTVAVTIGQNKVITLDFTGADELTLTAGQAYAIEVVRTSEAGSFALLGRSAGAGNVYTEGASFVNRNLVYTGGAKDLALGVHLVPEPATMALLASGGVLALIRRKRK